MAARCFKMKKICAIYNVWADGLDLLKKSIDNILPCVDAVIVVWSSSSNYGVRNDGCLKFVASPSSPKVIFSQCEPLLNLKVHENETRKRNHGLEIARRLEFDYFIMLDADEFYEQSAFNIEKQYYFDRPEVAGSVCKTKVYFKSPELTVGFDHTLVPFIHKITPVLKFELNNKTYPFTYDKDGHAHIDPTRRLNITTGVEWSNIVMHHFSWVRSDFGMKIQNSAARNNLLKSSINKDLENAKEGVYNEFYRKELKKCENIFNIPVYD
jgi:hypothetical protein